VRGYEFLHRVKNAERVFAMIKIVTDQAGYDQDANHWFAIGLDRDDLIKALEDASSGATPPRWGLDGCEFNGEAEDGGETLIVGDEPKRRKRRKVNKDA
jgi:hypothetical protein